MLRVDFGPIVSFAKETGETKTGDGEDGGGMQAGHVDSSPIHRRLSNEKTGKDAFDESGWQLLNGGKEVYKTFHSGLIPWGMKFD